MYKNVYVHFPAQRGIHTQMATLVTQQTEANLSSTLPVVTEDRRIKTEAPNEPSFAN